MERQRREIENSRHLETKGNPETLNVRFIKETMDPNIEQSTNSRKRGESSLAGLQRKGQTDALGKSTGS
jgi:hypothetical protein